MYFSTPFYNFRQYFNFSSINISLPPFLHSSLSPVRSLPHAPVRLTRMWWKPWQGHIPTPDCLLPSFQTTGDPCVFHYLCASSLWITGLCGHTQGAVMMHPRDEAWSKHCSDSHTASTVRPGNALALQDWRSTCGVQTARGHSWEANQAAE